METSHLIKRFGTSALMATLLAFGSAPQAAVVTQLIHFDDANNGWSWYSDADLNFLFDPTNLQSSVLCADSTNGGNGSCVIEGKGENGALPLMTRPEFGPTTQGSPNQDPDVSGNLLTFTLDSFYFLLNGEGTGGENAITVTGSNGATFTFALGDNFDAAGSPDIFFYEGADAGDLAGDLVKDTGYIATFGSLFQNVTWIQFSAPDSANLRLDCVVATFDGTTTEPKSGFSGACGGGGQVSEPGTLALLGLGLLGMVGWARRRRMV